MKGYNMNKLLTISIAAYNVENTIEECLNSFLPCQHFDLLELLVINDGSHDRTAEIVGEFEKKYPENIKLVNKKNGGHGSTLNKSLELASGKFYKVIDGDDWVNAKELDKLIDCLLTTQADLIINDYVEVYPDHTRLVSHRSLYQNDFVYSFDTIFPDGNFNGNLFAMHATTILTQRLRDVDMKIQEHCFYADTEFMYYVGLAARTVQFNVSCAYQYRLGVAGQSVSAEGIYKHIEDLLKIEYRLIQLYNNDILQIHSRVKKHYLFAIIDTRYLLIFDYFIRIIQQDSKDYLFIDFLRKVQTEYPEITRRFYLPLKYRLVKVYPSVFIKRMRFLEHTQIFMLLRRVKNKFC